MTIPLSLAVQPGSASTRLASGLREGMFIRNTDANNAVWLSPDSSVIPGTGLELGPLASTTWAEQQPCFAICDTGVVAPVSLILTTVVDNVDDPVAIATATAARLLVSGVPNVMSQTTLVNLPGIFTLAPGGSLVLNNMNTYASIVLTLNCATAAACRLDWDNNATFNAIDYLFGEYYSQFGSAESSSWLIPVNAGSVRITNTGINAFNIVVVGTNRIASMPMQLGKNNMPRSLSYSGALVAGTRTVMIPVDTDGSQYTRFNRGIAIRYAVSGGMAGLVGYQYIQQNGTTNQIYVANVAAGGQVFEEIAHPSVPCQWIILPNATTTGGASLDITWQGP